MSGKPPPKKSPKMKKETMNLFIKELAGFIHSAEDSLTKIEKDWQAHKGLFSIFSERMYTIRGAAEQFELPHIAEIAGLGEEIALKAENAESGSQVRKCVGALWDASTTVKFLLEHHTDETTEEQNILVRRLQHTLSAFGGARQTVSQDEIDSLMGEKKD